MRQNTGFTLAELLTALLILGVIATFTIPKILQSQQGDQKTAVFKETISAINELMYQGMITGKLTESCPAGQSDWGTYHLANINAVQICTNAAGQGCWTQADPTGGSQSSVDGYVMHNGATVAGIDNGCGAIGGGTDTIIIDWNGAKPPNTEGDDQIIAMMCFDAGGCGSSVIRAGQVGVHPSVHPTSYTLFLDIFGN